MPTKSKVPLDVGYLPIDHDHRQIGALMAKVEDAVSAGPADDALAALAEAAELFARHFAHEESLMTRHRFPNLVRHKEAHDDFLADLARYSQQLERKGVTPDVRRWVLGRFGDWFRFHIAANDVELGKFLAALPPGD